MKLTSRNKISNIIVILLGLFSSSLNGQSLIISFYSCRDSGKTISTPELSILKNNILIRTIQSDNPLSGSNTIKYLTNGEYQLLYISIFKKQIQHKVTISENRDYLIKLCIDSMDYSRETTNTFIDKLENNEMLTLYMYSQGCYDMGEIFISIKKENGEYHIKWGDTSKVLTIADIESIRQFELEMGNMNYGGCTTADVYIMKYKTFRKSIKDKSCSWHGIKYLRRKIFGDV